MISKLSNPNFKELLSDENFVNQKMLWQTLGKEKQFRKVAISNQFLCFTSEGSNYRNIFY